MVEQNGYMGGKCPGTGANILAARPQPGKWTYVYSSIYIEQNGYMGGKCPGAGARTAPGRNYLSGNTGRLSLLITVRPDKTLCAVCKVLVY